MADSRFYDILGPFSLAYILNHLGNGVKLVSPSQNSSSPDKVIIKGVSALQQASADNISIFTNSKYKKDFNATQAAACITYPNNDNPNKYILETHNPYYHYAKVVNLFYKNREVDHLGYISKNISLGSGCKIAPNVIIEPNVSIGNDCVIESGSIIKTGVEIGNNSHIGPNCYISHSIIGKRAVIFPGACIGREGFGIATFEGKHQKIFHIGRVIIGDDVEIGANSVVERGSINDTIISDMCKISHLVLIGHNVSLGYGCVVVGQSGIAGSTSLGKYCSIGGQAGISGHLKIADGVSLAAKSGVIKDIAQNNQIVGGMPAIPIKDWHKQSIILQRIIKNKNIS